MSVISCLLHKTMVSLTHFPILEATMMFLMAMLTYTIAELKQVDLAAIVAIFVFGILQSHYNRYNLSEESVQKAG